ncbi:diguanylate cyclase [Actinotalea ferrariae CF5-4]|uniref:Diguanylate cyclase n=1 Tax=Actinotalea ferrariae CF5-4 TaxID=948458 RepID=A0A021VYN2_9CELL|nr:bifunctional diguanylate cyclase/phosphodiesterase [Actinotalea ferrariae]EYR65120.1 diguanylate cyclase [Actinotalea ferrariae CF5-4]
MLRSAWIVHLCVGVLLVLAQGLAPAGPLSDALYLATVLLALGAIVVGVRLHRPARRRGWVLLGVGLALWMTGDLVWGGLEAALGGDAPRLPVDLLYLVGYVPVVAGLWQLAPRRSQARSVIAVLDALIVTSAVTTVLWVVVVQPSWTQPGVALAERLSGVLYPAADAFVLAYLVHLLLIARRRDASLLLLTTGFVTVLLGDALLQVLRVQSETWADARVLETAWLVSYVLCAAAALHPDMVRVGAPRVPGTTSDGSTLRVAYLAGSTLLLPAILLVESALGVPVHGTTVGLFSVVVIGLLAARLVLMIRRMEQQARHLLRLADTDFLTGLLNRRRFVHHVSVLTGQLRRHERQQPAALLVVGLSRFTEVNETLGHRIGDDLLRAVAVRLSEHRCEDAVLARLGGDVFGILLPGGHTEERALGCAEQVMALLRRPFVVSDLGVDLQGGVGVVLTPQDGVDPAELLHKADIAMSAARERTEHVARYDPAMEVGGALAPELMAQLGDALEDGQLVVHYQPQISLCTGEVVGAEALVRWQHPVHGLLAPGAFVPAAERTGQVRPLTRFVLDAALAQCARWQACGPYTVAVNLSVRNLLDPRIVDDVREAVERHGVDPGRVELEITETSAMVDREKSAQALRALHELGVVLSIDDYGTGYGSLAYLQELPVSRLKIDRSFVAGLRGDEASEAIVRSVVELSQRLGLSVVAEGIEDDETLLTLRDMHCDFAQGYGIARPVPPERLTAVTQEIRERLPSRLGARPAPPPQPSSPGAQVPQPRPEPQPAPSWTYPHGARRTRPNGGTGPSTGGR